MFKPFILSLASILCLATIAVAQTNTNTTQLKKDAVQASEQANANYAKALSLAKTKHWDLVVTTKNGAKAYLVGITPSGLPKYYIANNNTVAAATTRANQLWAGGASGLNLSGSSAFLKNKLAIWDGGSVLSTHVELAGRITQKDAPASLSDHATHVTGTMMASGVNPVAKGMAYGLQGILAYDFYNDVAEITNEAPNIILSNHSYGTIAGWVYNSSPSGGGAARWEFWGRPNENEDVNFGYYDDDSKSLDDVAYNAPYYLIVKAAGNNRSSNGPAVGSPYYRFDANDQMVAAGNRPAGISSNDGYDILPTYANAKNILTIGAVNGIASGYTKPSDVVMSTFSSWGPTDDGRIKPDLVADGVNVTSSVASGNSNYESLSGTSMASPNATGSLLLLQEYYAQLKAGSFMRSATLKGLAIHTAEEAGSADGPDYKFGWGLLNVEKAATHIKAAITNNNSTTSEHLLYENTLANGTTYTQTVVATGKGQLTATLCWTDKSGTVTPYANALNDRTIKLVNDLDIRITKGSTTYYPWILDPNNPANAATRGNNIRDNVERINIDSVVPGQTYTITISHKGTLSGGSQAYSLLVSGVGGTAICASAASNNAGTYIDSVAFTNIQKKNSTSCTTYTDNTNITGDIEANKTLPLTVKVASCDGTNANKIVKVFIDYNGNGSFTDAGELVATSGILTNGSVFTTNVTTASNITKGSYLRMRVIAQETITASDVQACGSFANGETQDYRLRVVQPSNDIAVTELVTPITGSGSNAAQLIAVRLRNYGSVDKSNIPLTATVTNGATTIATISVNCPLTITAGNSAVYTFQKTFTSLPATNYTITVTATATDDQDASNNTLTSNVAIAAKPAAPVATGVICNPTNITYTISNPVAGTNYYWYNTATSTTPIGTGTSLSLNSIPPSNTVYVESGARAGVGITSKNNYPSGGGYQGAPNAYMKYNATTPLILESVRLYSKYPGTVNLNLYNLASESSTGFSYYDFGGPSINVYATHPTPQAGTITVNDASDTGAIYYVGMSLPSAGAIVSYAIRATTSDNNMNLFRNNNLSTTNSLYPFTTTPNIVSLTGNSVQASSSASTYPAFYYYFYDMKLKTVDDVSERAAVVATQASLPTITIVGAAQDSLLTNAVNNIQWYLDGSVLNGAITNKIKPLVSGTYSLSGTTSSGCTLTSNGLVFTVANLPLNFINLSASQTAASQVQVNWQTANEINVQQFVIESSIDGNSFSAKGTVAAVNSGNYSFVDNSISNSGPQLYYRIKAIDKDGSISYSQVVRVQLGTSNVRFSVYPNPVKNQLQIQLQSSAKHTASIKITDVQGKVVWQQTVYLQAGNNFVSLATSGFARGSYLLTITGEQVYKQTIVKE